MARNNYDDPNLLRNFAEHERKQKTKSRSCSQCERERVRKYYAWVHDRVAANIKAKQAELRRLRRIRAKKYRGGSGIIARLFG